MAGRRSSVFDMAQRASRRLTTVEMWLDMRKSIYAAAGSGMRMITVDPQYDLEQFSRDESDESWPAWREGVGSMAQASTPEPDPSASRDPFSDTAYPAEKQKVTDADPTLPVAAHPSVSTQAEAEQSYHVLTKSRKWVLVVIIGIAGLFSGLSSNIYFPALDQIATDLQVSLGTVDLTITSYLIIQGISPVFWGSLSDAFGRRPVYVASFATYIIANIALSFSPNFAVLLIFRGLQSAGSASTVSIGNGVIRDISPPAERGAFISFYQAIRNFSIAIGPVLGGVLADFLGFRSIFVFLLILSTLTVVMIIILLPETSRNIAGNGSIRLKGIYAPLIWRVRKEPPYLRDPEPGMALNRKVTFATFTDPLKLLLKKDIMCNLVFGGVIYAIWSMVTSSTTGLFKTTFALSDIQLGLVFLPNGLGTIVGSTVAGKLMTRDFRAAEAQYKARYELPPDAPLPDHNNTNVTKTNKHLPADFPIEHARLKHLPWMAAVFAAATAGYGLSLDGNTTTPSTARALHSPGWIALPLALQFLVAATSNAVFALNQTLVADLCPGKGASSTAVNNLVRCGLGAVGVAVVETLLALVGTAPTFVGLALVVVMCTPLAVMTWYCGMGWRAVRMERMERKAAEKSRL